MIDERIAQLAAAQGGAVAVWQLRELGIGRGAIAHRVRAGRLHRRYQGVYAVGHTALSPRGRLWAAVLAGGRGCALSHRSAAAEWGIRPCSRPRVEVTCTRDRRSRPGIEFHVAPLNPADVTRLDGLPVTSVARTLLDLADVLRADALTRAVREAEFRRLLDVREIEELLGRSNGRRGTGRLRAALAVDASPTESPLEEEFAAFLAARGLPTPRFQATVNGHRVDAYWPRHGLVAELDGFDAHTTRRAFLADRRRDADHQLAGLRTLRVTGRDLRDAPDWLERTLRGLLR